MIISGEYYLVTASEWFITPPGYHCKAAWGKCKIVRAEEVFDFTPQRPSTNWFLEIGHGEDSIIIAGCHIHYAVKCKNRPVMLDGEKDGVPNNPIWFTE